MDQGLHSRVMEFGRKLRYNRKDADANTLQELFDYAYRLESRIEQLTSRCHDYECQILVNRDT